MENNIFFNPEINKTQVISKWSNGNIHFIYTYDSTGSWVEGKVITYYINGEIKVVHFCKKNIIEGEVLNFDANDKLAIIYSRRELKKFLNE
jgi:antitoxin component YwqK of YwqJK toxin-antitoxin module